MRDSEEIGGTSSFISLPLLLIIIGGCMYGICKDAGIIEESYNNETIINMDCNGNDNIPRIGWILLMTGVGLEACACVFVCCIMCITAIN